MMREQGEKELKMTDNSGYGQAKQGSSDEELIGRPEDQIPIKKHENILPIQFMFISIPLMKICHSSLIQV